MAVLAPMQQVAPAVVDQVVTDQIHLLELLELLIAVVAVVVVDLRLAAVQVTAVTADPSAVEQHPSTLAISPAPSRWMPPVALPPSPTSEATLCR
jgi:hypothetical protein